MPEVRARHHLRVIEHLLGGELLRRTAVAFLVRAMGAVAMLLMSLIVAHTLSVAESGLFFLGLAIVTFLATIGLLGLNQSVLRFVGVHYANQDWPTINAVVRQAARPAGISLALLSIALYLAAPLLGIELFGKPALGSVLAAFAPGALFLGLILLSAHQLQAIRRPTQSIVVLSVAVPFGFSAMLLLIGAETAQTAAALYSTVATAAAILGIVWWRRARASRERGRADNRLLWASSLPLWIVTLTGQATQWSGQLIAGLWVPARDLAYLAVAQRTALLVSFILAVVNTVVAPRFAALYAQQRHAELEMLALRAARLMTVFALPVVAAIVVFPEWILAWFGESYRAGAPLLVILAVAQFVNVMTGSVSYLLAMSGHERDLRNVVLFSGPLAIGAALILTPLFGVTGAALATALAIASQNLLAVHRVNQRLGFNTLAIWRSAH